MNFHMFFLINGLIIFAFSMKYLSNVQVSLGFKNESLTNESMLTAFVPSVLWNNVLFLYVSFVDNKKKECLICA